LSLAYKTHSQFRAALPPRFLTEGRMSTTKSGFACVYCV